MRSLSFMTAAVILFSCGSTVGQTRSTPTRNTPTTRMTTPATALTSPLAVPGTIPTPGGGPGSALGALQFTPSTSAAISASALGTITACPTTGMNAAPSGIIDASSAVAISGALVTQPLPGATIPPNSYFAPSIMNGTCNPAISAQNLTEFFNNTTVAPIPGLATITGPVFSDATIPSAATQAGGAGQSPLIIGPSILPSPLIIGPTSGPTYLPIGPTSMPIFPVPTTIVPPMTIVSTPMTVGPTPDSSAMIIGPTPDSSVMPP
jgi:hypothetical protein